jgi:Flp pilus assembly protein TadG
MARLSRTPLRLISSEDGSTAAFAAMGMFALLGMVALAVDVGMMLGARTDSQRVADSAALAGAASFITAPTDADRPRTWAIEYATKNRVHGATADVRPEDVDVLVGEQKVRVRVRNIAARGNAIRTVFGHVLGWEEMNVGTSAAAEVNWAAAGICPLPLALPDRWTEEDEDDNWDGPPQGGGDDLYIRYEEGTTDTQCLAGSTIGGHNPPFCDFTGFYPGNVNTGELIEIKVTYGSPSDGSSDYVASPCVAGNAWRCWFCPDPSGSCNTNTIRPWVEECPDNTLEISAGDVLKIAPGNHQSLVHQQFEDLVDNHPGEWSDVDGCVIDPGGSIPGCLGAADTWRIRFMPVVRPDQVTGNGNNTQATVVGLACVFVDKVAEDFGSPHGVGPNGRMNVYMRFVDTCTGVSRGGGPILKALQLVE